jgi:hypothetical protein
MQGSNWKITQEPNATSSEQIKRYQILNRTCAYGMTSTLHAYFHGPYVIAVDDCKIARYCIETCSLPPSVAEVTRKGLNTRTVHVIQSTCLLLMNT